MNIDIIIISIVLADKYYSDFIIVSWVISLLEKNYEK